MRITERVRAAVRAFVLGPAVVERWEATEGHAHDWSPEEYGAYLATSNGVYTCATLRATLLASMPFRLYRGLGESRKLVETGGLHHLLNMVNPFWTRSRLLEMTELSLCQWGQAFWFLERGQSGKRPPTEMYWARPDRVKVIPDPANYISGFWYTPANGAPPIHYDPGEVVWLRYPNPLDEYAGLSPLAASRIAADLASAAMHSNRNVFTHGNQMGGAVLPKAGMTLTDDQARELEKSLERRYSGVDKAHRWGVFKFDAELKQLGWAPKDAEFLGTLKWSLEDICRAYKVPLDLVGGQRTYENIEGAQRAMWDNCIIPEARFISSEIVEQLLPMFPGEADEAEFDTSGVAVLQEAADAAWTRAQGQLSAGAITVNEWRDQQGLKPVKWGDVWWAGGGVKPIEDAEKEPVPAALAAVNAVPGQTAAEEQAADREKPDEEPPADEAERKALLADLSRWQRKCEKAGKAKPFESESIPAGMKALIDARLQEDPDSAFDFLKALDPARVTAEKRLREALIAVLAKQLSFFANAIKDGTLDWDVLWAEFGKAISDAIDGMLVASYTSQVLRDAVSVGIDFDIAVINTAAWEWAKKYTYELVKGLVDTTRKLVSEVIARFVGTPGMTIGDITEKLEPGFGEARAQQIAVTETTRAYSAGQETYQGMLKEAGLQFERIWITSMDEKVCKVCQAPPEGILGDQPESKWPEQYKSGPPGHVGCRCHASLSYVGRVNAGG